MCEHMVQREDKWTRLPPHRRVGSAVVNGMLTAVGGERNDGVHTNTLVSLTDKWTETI